MSRLALCLRVGWLHLRMGGKS
ncbi:hypothetical protein V3C99_001021, partial [Haemonchus contortus]